jgi:outer membrane protein assembly factor BamB
MRSSSTSAFLATALAIASMAFVASADREPETWAQFRGPAARGIAEGAPLPTSWSVENDAGIAWKTAVPGLAHSSPVVWGDRLFVTTAFSAGDKAGIRTGLYGDIEPVDDSSSHRFEVWCLDRTSGKVLWKKLATEGVPKVKRHTKSTHANPTPTVDARRVVASFGSEGLYAYDHDGNLLWSKDLGVLDAGFFQVPSAQWGYASSPVLHDGVVIVQADVQKSSFLAAFDAASGDELWRTARDDVPTWSTPTVYDGGEKTQIIVNGYRHIGGYDFSTGAELWRMEGRGDIPIPTPYVVDDRVYLTSAHGPGSPIYVIQAGARGVIEPDGDGRHEHIVWSLERGGSYMPTSIVYRGLLYVGRDNGALSVYDAKTGERHDQKRLGSGTAGFIASSVAGDGKVYFTDEDGVTHVVGAGSKIEVLSENDLGETTLATPAIADGRLYFRTRGHVVAVEAQ